MYQNQQINCCSVISEFVLVHNAHNVIVPNDTIENDMQELIECKIDKNA